MSRSPFKSPLPSAEPASDRHQLLDSLATQALATVAERARADRADPDGSAAERLYAAATGADPRACAEVARALIADGLPAERICDLHIPAAARRLGEDWADDDLSFSAVTIGTARLQRLLRELDLELEHRAGAPSGGAGAAVLVVVAPGADHTLGAFVLASQLRRRGVSVRLSLGEAPGAMTAAMSGARFDAVFLSATVATCLPHLAQAVAEIRAAMPEPPPLVLGGALVQRGGPLLSGIDHVTCDLDEAIRLCNLTFAKKTGPTRHPLADPRR